MHVQKLPVESLYIVHNERCCYGSKMKYCIKTCLALIYIFSSFCFAKQRVYTKMQDEDYNKIYCKEHNGKSQVSGSRNGESGRADCITDEFAIKVDSILVPIEQNIEESQRYARIFKRRAKIVFVIENVAYLEKYSVVKKIIAENYSNISVEKLENFTTVEASLSAIQGPNIKKSNSGKCHIKGLGSYANTKKFNHYNNLESCLQSGGTLPNNISPDKMYKRDRELSGLNQYPERITLFRSIKNLTAGLFNFVGTAFDLLSAILSNNHRDTQTAENTLD